ncbi:hypothetical protein DFQ28_011175 [Apophysomyces sp. BC1034]|nr:hypothetical protein DFQ30_008408 [Apophysomyces sp. BC1015]KAG0182650.1 hypothetical protein DFQ29_002982 [Apophysomyces sp. BC1021]KAG0191700.1 hypothetical protein DFQ28_011175 [Apophysomyces sp. BC1034]
MVLSKNAGNAENIETWFKRKSQISIGVEGKENQAERQEQRELKLALELSKKEHEEEQQQLLNRYAQRIEMLQSNPVIDLSSQSSVDQPYNGESDDDFQTITSRSMKRKLVQKKTQESTSHSNQQRRKRRTPTPQPSTSAVNVKHEEEEDENDRLDIDDLSNWIDIKEEAVQDEESFDIDDLSAWIGTETTLPHQSLLPSPLPPHSPHVPIGHNTSTNNSIQQRPDKGKQRAYESLDDDILNNTQTRQITSRCTAANMTSMDDYSEFSAAGQSHTHSMNGNALEVECPLCLYSFPRQNIESHASRCSGRTNDISSTQPSSAPRPSPFESLDRHLQMDLDLSYSSPNTNDADKSERSEQRQCPICNVWIDVSMLQQHVDDELRNNSAVLDDEGSDCSVIDLCASQQDGDDDGYLSPLEGFVNILDHRNEDPEFQRYFDHVTPSTSTRQARPNNNQANRRAAQEEDGENDDK